MMPSTIERFAPVIRALTTDELKGTSRLNEKLRIAKVGEIEICYAPFEYINKQAKVVIVGITPGRTQWLNALSETKAQLSRGSELTEVLRAAKATGAFSGAMRPNLIELLDSVGIQRWLGLPSCGELFGRASHLMQSASLIRNPVFVKGENYSGKPSMVRTPVLREQLLTTFGETLKALPKSVFVPLGDTVAEGLQFLARQGLLNEAQILAGLPHPSGANGERIAYFVGRKNRSALSAKTSPEKLDQAREMLLRRVRSLP